MVFNVKTTTTTTTTISGDDVKKSSPWSLGRKTPSVRGKRTYSPCKEKTAKILRKSVIFRETKGKHPWLSRRLHNIEARLNEGQRLQ